MKHSFFATCAILVALYCQVSLAQTIDISVPGLRYSSILDTLTHSIASNDTAEGGKADGLQFFNAFWSGRVTANDSSGFNMFDQYHNYVRKAVAEKQAGSSCGSGFFQGNWQAFGPNSVINQQSAGKFEAVWGDDLDTNYILAGATGGLFKTSDGGKNFFSYYNPTA